MKQRTADLFEILKGDRAALREAERQLALGVRAAAVRRTRPEIQRAVERLLESVRREVDRTLYRTHLEGAPATVVERLADWPELARKGAEALFLPILGAFEEAEKRAPRLIRKANLPAVVSRTDAIGRRAVQWAYQRSGELVTEVLDATRVAIQRLIVIGIESGRSVEATGRLLREVVGLTDRMTEAVARKYADALRLGVSERAAEKLAGKYASHLHAYRAEMIARTETAAATSAGLLSAFRDNGMEMVEWVGDANACDDCQALSGQTFPIAEAEGMLPQHPNCECAWVTVGYGDAGDGGLGGPAAPGLPEPPDVEPEPVPTPAPAPAPAPVPLVPIAPSSPPVVLPAFEWGTMPKKTSKRLEAEVRRLVAEYQSKLKKVMASSVNDILARFVKKPNVWGAYWDRTKSIAFKNGLGSAKKLQSIAFNKVTGFHFSGDLESVVRHEFGHHVDDIAGRISKTSAFQADMNRLKVRVGQSAIESGYPRSRPAGSDSYWSELFAELFERHTRPNWEGYRELEATIGKRSAARIRLTMEKYLKPWRL